MYVTVQKEGNATDIFTNSSSANESGSTGIDPSTAEFAGVPVPDDMRHSTSNQGYFEPQDTRFGERLAKKKENFPQTSCL